MTTGEMYMIGLVFSLAIAGYFFGRARGFDAGKAERNDTGWEDEARWWRKNSTGLRDATDREHDE
jgi:hypothetical protein